MNTIYFTAGPSQIYPSYHKHLQEASNLQLGSINHRSERFRKIYQHTDEQVRQLLNIPQGHFIFFASSATEIWEKMILNLVEAHSFHFVNGAFSSKFYEFATLLQKKPSRFNVNEGLGFDIQTVSIPDDTELICTTQNETSTGVYFPTEDLHALKIQNPTSLLCTDLVSIAPYSEIDYQYMDSSFFSVQKAFGLPPGLGVWIVNEACLTKAENLQSKGINQGAHNSLLNYYKNYQQFETPSTPNVIAIYLLGKIAEDMNQKGIKTIREELNTKAAMIYEMAKDHELFNPLVEKSEHQSTTVAVLKSAKPSEEIIKALVEKNMQVSNGYGNGKGKQIRIANFPTTSIEDMEKLIHALNQMKQS